MKKILALLFALLASPVAAQVIPSGSWGSINYWGVGGLSQVLTPGLAGQCLQTQGVGSAPIWTTCFTMAPQNANTILANVTTNFVAPQAVDINRVLDTVGYDIARPPAVESILYKSNVGPTFNWQTLPPGTTGSLLTSGGPTNPPFWAPTATQASLASICQTVGAVLYFDTPSLLWKCLNPGTSGQLLQTAGGAANPSWLTVTPASVGAVPVTRNVNTAAPLGGGGALSADLTLTCATCATTTNGGALSATAPETISAAGVIACATCATTTNGGALSATAPMTISAAGVIALTGPPPWTNVRLSKSANYPAVTGDCFDTIALNGNVQFTLTINAASGYLSTCAFVVVNEDSGRGKQLAVNGYSTFTLWPNQTRIIYNQNNVWQCAPSCSRAERWSINSPQFNADTTNGVDSNNDCLGTTTGACATIQRAIDLACFQTDGGNSVANITPALGSYAPIQLVTHCLGQNCIHISGDIVNNPPQVVITTGVAGPDVYTKDKGCLTVSGLTLHAGAAGVDGLSCGQNAIMDADHITFGHLPGGNMAKAIDNCEINLNTNIALVDNNSGSSANAFMVGQQFGRVQLNTNVTITGTFNFTGDGCIANNSGLVNVNGSTITGGTVTGTRFLAVTGGGVVGGAANCPGNVAGTTTAPGYSN